MKFDGIEGLTDVQKKIIIKEHNLSVSQLEKKYDELLADVKKTSDAKKEQDEQVRKDKKQVDADKIHSATTLDEMKNLLKERDEKTQQLEQRILDGEKKRVDVENSRTVDSFVDKFINSNVVNDSLVRDAIKSKISTRLGVRDGNIVELNGSELTGKTGDQVLSEIKSNKDYSNHLITNNAKGGGATGGSGNSAGIVDKTMSRAEFDNTSPLKVAEFIREGGNVVD